jgi:hypothetical protein
MEAKRSWVALAVGVAVAAAFPASASAATQIGQTFPPTSACTVGTTYLQTAPIATYQVPSAGVITSWSFEASAAPPAQLKFKAARNTASGQWTTLGDSAVEAPVAATLNTFPARIAVQAGDNIGLISASGGSCGRAAGGVIAAITPSDPPPGTAAGYTPAPMFQLDVSATLEPDADNDGFGDETQDCDPGDPTKGEDCGPPTATITKGPKDKTRKKTATFEFTGSDVRAISSFQCKLDAGAFAPCTSPHTVKVKKGKHIFQVQALDRVGNVGSAATDTWKRKKKKK